ERNLMAHRGGKLGGGEQKAAVAGDRDNRHVGPRVLRAERVAETPAERVLVARREKRARSIDRKQQPGGKADLRNLIDKNPVLGKLGADRVEECNLRGKFFQPL